MKQFIALGLACCLALSLSACGKKASSYEVEVVGPAQTSEPRPSTAPGATPTPTPAPGWVVSPRTDLEITASLAEYGLVESLSNTERKGLAFFSQEGKTGVIDLEGNIVVPAEEDVHWCPVCGITNEDESKIYNAKGDVVGMGGHGASMGGVYYNPENATLYLDDGMGYLTPWQEGMVYSPEAFVAAVAAIVPDEAGQYEIAGQAGLYSVGQATGYRLMKPDGSSLDGVDYQALGGSSEGVFSAKMAGLWGFVNAATGEQTVPFVYSQVRPFKESLAAVQADTGWGYISLAGTAKTSMDFLGAHTAVNGLAWVKTNQGWGVARLSEWPA